MKPSQLIYANFQNNIGDHNILLIILLTITLIFIYYIPWSFKTGPAVSSTWTYMCVCVCVCVCVCYIKYQVNITHD